MEKLNLNKLNINGAGSLEECVQETSYLFILQKRVTVINSINNNSNNHLYLLSIFHTPGTTLGGLHAPFHCMWQVQRRAHWCSSPHWIIVLFTSPFPNYSTPAIVPWADSFEHLLEGDAHFQHLCPWRSWRNWESTQERQGTTQMAGCQV